MIEKRFSIEESILKEGLVIQDKEHEYTFPVLESGMNFMFNKALNELDFENRQLRKENKGLEQKIKSIIEILNEDIGYIDSFKKIEEVLK